ncbi:hypothetical protein WG899_00560 [Paucibacter sp. AS339]|uniref:hypothetical protein n=1 Tax=Paucibacter hankyongi TaxID=3133434 RepID=UPI0030B45C2B
MSAKPLAPRTTPTARPSTYAIKTEIRDPQAKAWQFLRQKTMYGGKAIAAGDTIYIFDSENTAGKGLVAKGLVISVEAIPRLLGVERQTPRVNLIVARTAFARHAFGRMELKGFTQWDDGRPETELNFKFYRQATDKIIGLSDLAAAYLEGSFTSP